MSRNRLILLAFAVWLALAVVSCAPKPPPEPVTFTIEMSEYAFKPDTIRVRVGQEVTLNLVNKGQLLHEIMFGQGLVRANNRPNGYDKDLFATAGVMPTVTGGKVVEDSQHEHSHGGFMLMLPNTDDQATIQFVVTEEMLGTWEMGCFEQDGVHYDAGMKGKLIVEK